MVSSYTSIQSEQRGQQEGHWALPIVYVSNMTTVTAVAIMNRHAKNSLISTFFTVSNASHHARVLDSTKENR